MELLPINLSHMYISQTEIDQLQHWIDMLEAEHQEGRINAMLEDKEHERKYNKAA